MNNRKFFTSKQNYMTFRKAFAEAQISPRNKKGKPGPHGEKSPGWISSSHFILLNIIRGLPWYRGFSPKTSKNYIENFGNADQGILDAWHHLANVVQCAKKLLDPTRIKIPSYYDNKQKDKEKFIARTLANSQAFVNDFLEPFSGTLTLADLVKISIPKFSIVTDREKYISQQVNYVGIIPEADIPFMNIPMEEQKPIAVTIPVQKGGLLARIFS
jgi:hypothetical protein